MASEQVEVSDRWNDTERRRMCAGPRSETSYINAFWNPNLHSRSAWQLTALEKQLAEMTPANREPR